MRAEYTAGGRTPDAGRDVLQQLQILRIDGVLEQHESGGVAARPRMPRHPAGANRVAAQREHGRHGRGVLSQHAHHGGWTDEDNVWRARENLLHDGVRARVVAIGPADVADEVALAPAQTRKLVDERGPALPSVVVAGETEQRADPANAARLRLATRGARPRRCA